MRRHTRTGKKNRTTGEFEHRIMRGERAQKSDGSKWHKLVGEPASPQNIINIYNCTFKGYGRTGKEKGRVRGTAAIRTRKNMNTQTRNDCRRGKRKRESRHRKEEEGNYTLSLVHRNVPDVCSLSSLRIPPAAGGGRVPLPLLFPLLSLSFHSR